MRRPMPPWEAVVASLERCRAKWSAVAKPAPRPIEEPAEEPDEVESSPAEQVPVAVRADGTLPVSVVLARHLARLKTSSAT